MIYITGDTHGDFRRFSTDSFPEQKGLTKSDYVIVCGDFGIWADDRNHACWMQWLDEKPFTTLFVDGNHENFDMLKEFPVEHWNGGKVQFISESVIRLCRGETFSIDGHTFFVMGGAKSHDITDGILEPDDPNFKQKRRRLDREFKLYRINHLSWWEEEMPCKDEYNNALENLDRIQWKVDFVVSHCAPSSVQSLIHSLYLPDELTEFLEHIKNNIDCEYWFFGHYHDNLNLEQKFRLLYDQFIPIGSCVGK